MVPYKKRKKINTYIRIVALVCVSSLISIAALADDPGTPGNNEDPDAPIDGGISVLIACGVGYGVKRLANKKTGNAGSVRNDQ